MISGHTYPVNRGKIIWWCVAVPNSSVGRIVCVESSTTMSDYSVLVEPFSAAKRPGGHYVILIFFADKSIATPCGDARKPLKKLLVNRECSIYNQSTLLPTQICVA